MTNRFTKSEKSTNHFVKSQFPDFFLDEGEGIVNFIDEYYRHFSDNTGHKIRDLQLQGDIDTTSNTNLIKFNNKYTFGSGRFIKELPAVITGDLRFIIKHIKDLYRSKGTERGIKLFFRLSFNDSPEIFVPGTRLFRPSDSRFNRPDIIEIFLGEGNNFETLNNFQGKEIFGSLSGASAITKSVFKKRINGKNFFYIELDNVQGSFRTGDKVVFRGATAIERTTAPKVIGPINDIIVESGSENVPLGTTFEALPNKTGVGLKASVTEVEKTLGTFKLRGVEGYGYSSKSNIIVTRAPGESNQIDRGKFSVSINGNYSTHVVNGDFLKIFDHLTIGTANVNGFQFDSTDSLNAYNVSPISDILSNEERSYGKILKIDVNEEPKNYNGLRSPFVAIKDLVFSANQVGNCSLSNTLLVSTNEIFSNSLITVANTLSGNVSLTSANNKVIGIGTNFTQDFKEHDVLKVMTDEGLPTFHNIDSITNTTFMTIGQDSPYDITNNNYSKGFLNFIKLIDSDQNQTVRAVNNFVNSTAVYLDDKVLGGELNLNNPSYTIRIGYNTSNVNFSELNDPLKSRVKTGVTFTDIETGIDADFDYKVTSSEGTVSEMNIINAGFGYKPGEEIRMRSEKLTPSINITDLDGRGTGAEAFAILNDGKVTDVIVTKGGSGYFTPSATVFGGTGSGAKLTVTNSAGVVTNISVANTGSNYFETKDINIKIQKGGQSILEGRHLTINSELNRKIKIQDSNFWQEYSYEIESTINNEKYENIVDGLIHMSGRKFFTKNVIKDDAASSIKILEESVTASGV